MSKTLKKIIFTVVPFLLVLIFQPIACSVIDSGEIGIKFHKWSMDEDKYGGVEGTCHGWVFYNGYTTDIYSYPTYVQYKNYAPFKVTSKEGTIFTMDSVRIAYRVNPDKACDIFVNYRRPLNEIEEGYIKTCISEAYRLCGSTFSDDSLLSHRADFEASVRAKIDKSLGNEGFVVTEFTQQIDPPSSLVEMINAKTRAVQSALKAENEVKEAEAKAKIAIAKARGESEAKKIAADAEAYANSKIASSITPTLVQKMWVEKWDGDMPSTMTGNGTMMMVGNK